MTTTSTQTSTSAADYQAQVDQLFVQYEGRHATADELSTLGQQLASGSRSLAAVRADLVGSSAGQTYLSGAIGQVYQGFGGRAATSAEVAVWENEMSLHGATLATVRVAVLADPLGTNYSAAQVIQAFQAALGRAPTVGELAQWQTQFLAGLAQPSSVATALSTALAASAQVTALNAQITQAYQQYGGRAPTDAELATWRDTLAHGGTLARLKADIVADPLGTNYLNAQVTALYQQYGGRAPTTQELATWHDTLAGNGTLAQVKADIIADPLGTNYLNAQVTAAYQQWEGRAPTAAELATWHGTFAGGGTLAQLKGDLLADAGTATYQAGQLTSLFASHGWGTPTAGDVATLMTALQAGQSFADAAATVPHHNIVDPGVLTQVYDGYAAWLGRAPTTAEAQAAAAYVHADGTGTDQLRAALLGGSEGHGYLDGQVTALYQQLLGRAPTAGELAGWEDQVINQGGTFDQVRTGLLDTSEGHALAGATVTDIYARYLGRAPTAGELQDGISGLNGGRTVAGITLGAFTSAEGQVHFSDTLAALYAETMGRAPTPDESSSWFGAIFAGADYTMVRAALMLDPASTATHLIGTTGNDRLALGAAPGDVVVSAFDPAHDQLVVAAALAGTNLLDAAHATQVLSLDDTTPNVLIKLDDHDTLLLHGVTLAQLSAADFAFG